jgi:hypothetical protein
VAGRDGAVRGGGFGQREGLGDEDPELAVIGQPGQLPAGGLADLRARGRRRVRRR